MSRDPAIAVLTPSYAHDHGRCELLCESMDTFAEGRFTHYILVADHDYDLFSSLAGPRRRILRDSELLPPWLKAVRRPFDRRGRHVWISSDIRRQVRPLSGWHVQQLRKLAAATVVDEHVVVMADSDSLFVRPFGAAAFVNGERVRLYRRAGAIHRDGASTETGMAWEEHVRWTEHAARVLSLPAPSYPADDFINNLVSWRRDMARATVKRIEENGAAPFPLVLGRAATLSEYQIYGMHAVQIAGLEGHFDSEDALSHTYWAGEALDTERLAGFMGALKPHQIALCVQSFTDTPVEIMRALTRAGAPAAAHT